MAWKPKTIVGKILKVASIGIGGAVAVGTGVGAVAGVAGGTGLLAGALAGAGKVVKAVGGGTKTVLSSVSAGAKQLITGQSKENQAILAEAKDQAKAANQKLELVEKLKLTGLSEAEALMRAGVAPSEAPSKLPSNTLVYAGGVMLALVLLPKLFNRR